MYDGPIREGSRGGRDQFSWESVKADKDREFYLGHSVKALVGHWQKNKDPYWYTRSKNTHDAALAEEVKAVKAKEEELMLEALGMKKATKKRTTDFGKRLQKYEVEGLLKRREKEDGEEAEAEELGPRGLGFRRTASTMAACTTHEVLEGVGLTDRPLQQRRQMPASPQERQTEKRKKKKRREERSPRGREKKSRRRSPRPRDRASKRDHKF